MELRQLTTDREREIFAQCLSKARATRGFGFRENPRSKLGRAHLTFGNLYALFETEGDPPERMIAGVISHDLATLPQSFPKPDLTHLPPQSVVEGGELWSLSRGAGQVVRIASGAIAGIVQAQAILAYPILEPVDLTPAQAELNFVKACEPVEWPYAETIEGGKILVQPMILEGEGLQAYVRLGFELLFRSRDSRRALRFEKPFGPQQPLDLRA